MKCRQRRRIKPLDILLAAICAVSLTAAALIGWTIFHQDAVYRELSIDAEADAGDCARATRTSPHGYPSRAPRWISRWSRPGKATPRGSI